MLVFQRLGHITAHNALRQPFDNGGLTDTWLTNQDRVVLGTAAEHLNDTSNLFISPNHRIEFPLSRQLGQIATIFFQGLVGAFWILIGDALCAANGGKGLQHILMREPGCSQYTRRGLVTHIEQGEQQMLNAEVFVMELPHLTPGCFEHLTQAGRNAGFASAIDARHALDLFLDDLLSRCQIPPDLRDDLLDHATFLIQKGGQQMCRFDLAMIRVLCKLIRRTQG